ncbi:hypothetical protein [Archangium violaceum]|uniref:hypothetical protein n=1 Tax=Archangium violaceum TaxID=83451 RepID=UPI0036DA1CE4
MSRQNWTDVNGVKVNSEVLASLQAQGLFIIMGEDGTALFYSSPGAVLQGDWMFSQSFSLYARYTIIHYSVPGTSVDYSGNAFGMGLGWLPRLK